MLENPNSGITSEEKKLVIFHVAKACSRITETRVWPSQLSSDIMMIMQVDHLHKQLNIPEIWQ